MNKWAQLSAHHFTQNQCIVVLGFKMHCAFDQLHQLGCDISLDVAARCVKNSSLLLNCCLSQCSSCSIVVDMLSVVFVSSVWIICLTWRHAIHFSLTETHLFGICGEPAIPTPKKMLQQMLGEELAQQHNAELHQDKDGKCLQCLRFWCCCFDLCVEHCIDVLAMCCVTPQFDGTWLLRLHNGWLMTFCLVPPFNFTDGMSSCGCAQQVLLLLLMNPTHWFNCNNTGLLCWNCACHVCSFLISNCYCIHFVLEQFVAKLALSQIFTQSACLSQRVLFCKDW